MFRLLVTLCLYLFGIVPYWIRYLLHICRYTFSMTYKTTLACYEFYLTASCNEKTYFSHWQLSAAATQFTVVRKLTLTTMLTLSMQKTSTEIIFDFPIPNVNHGLATTLVGKPTKANNFATVTTLGRLQHS